MASRVYTSIIYAIIRLSIWGVLFAAALLDGLRHRGVRSRGWQLYYLLILSVGLFLVRNLFFLGICIEGNSSASGWASKGIYSGYIFWADVAESFWIFLLLAISSGFCITRTNFGPHKTVCIVIPLIFLFTSFVVDYVLFAQVGLDAFDYKNSYASSEPIDPETYDPAQDPLSGLSGETGLLFVFCMLANMMAFFIAWFYMYDTARSEWQALQDAGINAAAPGDRLPPVMLPTQTVQSGSAVVLNSHSTPVVMHDDSATSTHAATGVGHSAIPLDAVLLEEGQNASHLYGGIMDQDLDAPKSIAERIDDRNKIRLMKRFFFAVSAYLITAMIVFFLPLFVPMAVDAALLVMYDCLLWLFCAGLLVVFRMRETNQFLLLTDDGVGGGETTTELGVLYHDDEEDGQQRLGGGGGSNGMMNSSSSVFSGSSRQGKVDDSRQHARFTLEEEHDDDNTNRK